MRSGRERRGSRVAVGRGRRDDKEDEENEEEEEEEKDEEEEKRKEEEEETTDIKSNNPHLAGGEPETAVESKGKAGRPKIRYTDTREEAEKRDGSSQADEPKNRKKRNKKKDEALPAITAHDADDEGDQRKRIRNNENHLYPVEWVFKNCMKNLPMPKIKT